jgi:hypothetical protein
MRTAFPALLCLVVVLAACVPGRGEEPKYPKAGPVPACADAPGCAKPCAGPGGLHWTGCCFPHSACADDYCPNPLPR